jgi:hypothetical protein
MRRGRYVLAAAVYRETAGREVAALVRRHRLPGQRRWHTKRESDARRRRFLRDCVESDLIRAWVYSTSPPAVLAREELFGRLTADLAEEGVSRLMIERADPEQDARDRRVIQRALVGVSPHVRYDHVHPAAEAGVQIADGFAWAYGARGLWRRQILPLIDIEHDLDCHARSPARRPSGREPGSLSLATAGD